MNLFSLANEQVEAFAAVQRVHRELKERAGR